MDWQVVCTFPDGEMLGYDHVMPWVSAVEISGFAPRFGPIGGGTIVTIKGHGFTNASSVQFGGNAAHDLQITNDLTMTAVSPSVQSRADVSLQVTTPAGTTRGQGSFSYL